MLNPPIQSKGSLARLFGEYTLITLCLATALAGIRPEFIEYFSTRYIGGAEGDAGLYVWLVQSFLYDPIAALRYESSAMYPYPLSRAWSDNFLLPSFAVWMITKLGVSEMPAYNCVVLLALVLNGVAFYAVGRRLSLTILWAFCVALTTMLSSVILGNLGHPQLIYLFWLPLIWMPWCRDTISPHGVFFSVLSISGAFYCSVYYAIFGALGVAALAPFILRRLCTEFLIAPRSSRTLFVAKCAIAGITGLLPIVPSIPAYLQVKAAFGARHLYEPHFFSAKGVSYLAFPPLNQWFADSSSLSHGEAFLASSYLLLCVTLINLVYYFRKLPRVAGSCFIISSILLVICSSVANNNPIFQHITCASAWLFLITAFILAWREFSHLSTALWITSLFFVLSFGPVGNPVEHEPAWAPFSLVFWLFPGFESVRASGRLGLVPALTLFLIGFVSLLHLIQRYRAKKAIQWLTIPLTAWILAENYLTYLPIDSVQPKPDIFALLHDVNIHKNAAVILPFSEEFPARSEMSWRDFATKHTRYMIWSIATETPIVNGYSGQRTRLQEDLITALRNFPSDSSISILKRICGLRYIVVLKEGISPSRFAEILAALNSYASTLFIAGNDSAGNILLELKDLEMRVDPKLPFFAPINKPTIIKIRTATANDSCSATIKLWEKTDRKLSTSPLQTIEASDAPTSAHIELSQLDAATPGVLSVVGESCPLIAECTTH